MDKHTFRVTGAALIAAGLAVLLAGCMEASLSQTGEGEGAATISIQDAPGVDEITLTVSGPGMDTIEETFDRDTDAIVLEIPTGEDRVFEIAAGPYSARVVRDVTAGGVEVRLTLGAGEDAILFTSNYEGSGNVYLVSADGSEPIQLTESEEDDFYAEFTPDGSQVVFLRGDPESDTEFDLYLMDSDGSNQELVREDVSVNATPDSFEAMPVDARVSPDGTGVVYKSSEDSQLHFISFSDG
ncbi:MAG: TolB family protein, partial [Spirochaetaceae bacterium]